MPRDTTKDLTRSKPSRIWRTRISFAWPEGSWGSRACIPVQNPEQWRFFVTEMSPDGECIVSVTDTAFSSCTTHSSIDLQALFMSANCSWHSILFRGYAKSNVPWCWEAYLTSIFCPCLKIKALVNHFKWTNVGWMMMRDTYRSRFINNALMPMITTQQKWEKSILVAMFADRTATNCRPRIQMRHDIKMERKFARAEKTRNEPRLEIHQGLAQIEPRIFFSIK